MRALRALLAAATRSSFTLDKHARVDRRGDRRDRHAEIERDLRRPLAGALLAGLVEDHVDERLPASRDRSTRKTCAVISIRNDSSGPRFHSSKTSASSPAPSPEAAPQDVVRLGDELHVAVLDAVVHHLDEVAGAVGPDVRDARPGVGLAPRSPRGSARIARHASLRAARHQRRTEARALLAARHAAADEVQPLSRAAPPRGALRVLEPRVAAVDDACRPARAAARACSIVSSTGAPALIIIMIRRGRSSAATKASKRLRARRALRVRGGRAGTSSIHSVSRFQTATGKPCSSMLSARLRPIVPSPMTPNCVRSWLSPARRPARSNARSRAGRRSSSPMSEARRAVAERDDMRRLGAAASTRPTPRRSGAGCASSRRVEAPRRRQFDALERRRLPRIDRTRISIATSLVHCRRDDSQPAYKPRANAVARLDGQACGSRRRPGQRNVEEVRHQRTPAGQPGPAEIGDRGVFRQWECARPHGRGVLRIENHPVGKIGNPFEHFRIATSPPDRRGQAREPERRDRVVQVIRAQLFQRNRMTHDTHRWRRVRAVRDQDRADADVGHLLDRIRRFGEPLVRTDDDDRRESAHARAPACPRRGRSGSAPVRCPRRVLPCPAAGAIRLRIQSQRPPATAVARHQRVGLARPPLARLRTVGNRRRAGSRCQRS